ncbi:EF-hand calcium-binding domain-containing protein 5-like isoform X2 [Gigantopelta aegis]|uniref:EF-hand calcium-binding domain-containing protein 5-like isoform X2 n=1 Tax=Gigantopelta aegis TaxID=1735272 RepID=UPI001B888DE1|nr:EF-hand calcium-binding domain-containing protein 5-like isoform X2 [Gigantopelta aegis]
MADTMISDPSSAGSAAGGYLVTMSAVPRQNSGMRQGSSGKRSRSVFEDANEYLKPSVQNAGRRWKRLHEQAVMERLAEMRRLKKSTSLKTKVELQKLARKIPIELLAQEWLKDNLATLDVRAYLVDKVFPTLILGVEKLLTETDARGLAEVEVMDANFNPLNYLAQYLMRNNPRYSNFSEASPYVRSLRDIGVQLRTQLFGIQDNRLARIKAEVKRNREERERMETIMLQEKTRREEYLRNQFQDWNISPTGRVELSLLQNALKSFAEIVDKYPEELREGARFTHPLESTDETGTTLNQTEFTEFLSLYVDTLPSVVFDQFMDHLVVCAAAHRLAVEREARRILLTNLFIACDHSGIGILDRHRILNLFEKFYDNDKFGAQEKLRNPRRWPVVEVEEADDTLSDEEEEPEQSAEEQESVSGEEEEMEEVEEEVEVEVESPCQVEERATKSAPEMWQKTVVQVENTGVKSAPQLTVKRFKRKIRRKKKTTESEPEKDAETVTRRNIISQSAPQIGQKTAPDAVQNGKILSSSAPAVLEAKKSKESEKENTENIGQQEGGSVEQLEQEVEITEDQEQRESAEQLEETDNKNAELKQSSEEDKQSSEEDKQSSEEDKQSSEEDKQTSEELKQSSEELKESTEVQEESVEVQEESAEVQKESIEVQKESAEVLEESAEEQKDEGEQIDKTEGGTEVTEEVKEDAEKPEDVQADETSASQTQAGQDVSEKSETPSVKFQEEGLSQEVDGQAGSSSSVKAQDGAVGQDDSSLMNVTFAEGTAFDREKTNTSLHSRSQSQLSAFDENLLNVSQFVGVMENFLGDSPNRTLLKELFKFIKQGYEETEEEKLKRLTKVRTEVLSAKRKVMMDQLFEKWDNDGSGYLDLDEVEHSMYKYKDGQETAAIKQAKKELKKQYKCIDERLTKREFRTFILTVVDIVPGADTFDYFMEFLTNSLERSHAERIRGEARKKWLQQIVAVAQTSGASMEPVYKEVFHALFKDAESHGGGKKISANISMLEHNPQQPERGPLHLRYVAATLEDAEFILGKILYQDMPGISFAAVESGQPIHVPRVATHGNIQFWNPDHRSVGSLIVIPLRDRKKRVFGLLGIDTLRDSHHKAIFITHEIQFFQGVANSFSIAYHHVDLRRKLMKITESAVSWVQKRSPHVHDLTVYMVEPDGRDLDYVLRKMMYTDNTKKLVQHSDPPRLERKDNLFRDYLFKSVDNSESVTADAYGERHLTFPLRDDQGHAIAVVDISIGTLKKLPPHESKEAQRMMRLLQTALKEITREFAGAETNRVLDAEMDDDMRIDIMFDRIMLVELRDNVTKLDNKAYAELSSYNKPPKIVHDILKATLAVFNLRKAQKHEYDNWSKVKANINSDLAQKISKFDPTADENLFNPEKVEIFLEKVPHYEVLKHGSLPAQHMFNWVFVTLSLVEHTLKNKGLEGVDLSKSESQETEDGTQGEGAQVEEGAQGEEGTQGEEGAHGDEKQESDAKQESGEQEKTEQVTQEVKEEVKGEVKEGEQKEVKEEEQKEVKQETQ